jgi:hypothetical protein
MKKIYALLFTLLISSISFGQNITQWNFDNVSPATAMLPTTGSGTFTKIGGVADNLTGVLMPGGNPAVTGNLAYSVKNFPTADSGTAGFRFDVSTAGYNDPINVTFDPRGSNTSSRFQQYEYSIDAGATWTVFSNNSGLLTNAFTTNPMVTLVMPVEANNKIGFAFRIVSIFDPAGTSYSAVGYAATTPSVYNGATGAWRIDNFTVSNGVVVLSVNQNEIAGLKVYPNPVSNGVLHVESNLNTERTISLFDVLGKQVLSTTTSNNTINVAALNSGVYIVKITEGGNTATRKVVIR